MNSTKTHRTTGIILVTLLLLFILFVVFTAINNIPAGGVALIFFWFLFALAAGLFESTKPFRYPLIVIGCVTSSMYFPNLYREYFGIPTTKCVIPILQMIMFGMGMQLSLKDFRQILIQPWGVFIGVAAQFLIMPIVGFVIATVFSFSKEVAAGIILVGCVPCGIASNVMNFLAKANVALSLSLTTVATLLGPLMTPLWMRFLIGESLSLDYYRMVWDIVNLVIVPIVAGILVQSIFRIHSVVFERILGLFSMFGLLLTIVFINAAGRDNLLQIGILLIIACLLHNLIGYFLGYWLAWFCRLDEKSCRTIAIEVGMQNGGLASALAVQLGKASTMGLAPAICSPLMNITGAALAIWWRKKSPPTISP
ncbi:MAG: bile acid:sodium symporter family protein [Planctomycetaceae bacterium]|jgi:BASS family bile acid:Na+ symporter|nr:bile acid:sodium symporter family protein [Planctomycetaceae bacterium]